MKRALIILSVLCMASLGSCSLSDTEKMVSRPDFEKKHISLRFDNREQHQNAWQTYLNDYSESLLAIGTARAERGRKTHPDGLSPFYDALLNHPSEVSVHVIPVYMVSYADYQRATAETRVMDIVQLDTSRMSGVFVFKGEVIGFCKARISRSGLSVSSWSDMTQKAFYNESFSDNAEGKYLASMLEQGKSLFYLSTITDEPSSTSFWPSGYEDICFTQTNQISFIRWNELLKKVETGDIQELFRPRLYNRDNGLL